MLTMIIVDDEQIILESLATLIDWKSVGVTVVGSASNGAAAIDLTLTVNPDIILSDISMPHFTGLQMLETLRRNGITAEVIFISAYSRFDYAKEALTHGAFDYILKPIQEDLLLETVRRCGEKIRLEREQKQGVASSSGEEVSLLLGRLLGEGRNPTEEELATLEEQVPNFASYHYFEVLSIWGEGKKWYRLLSSECPKGMLLLPTSLDQNQKALMLLLSQPDEKLGFTFLRKNIRLEEGVSRTIRTHIFPLKEGFSAANAELGFAYITAQKHNLFSLSSRDLESYREALYPQRREGIDDIISQIQGGNSTQVAESLYRFLATLYWTEATFEMTLVKLRFIELFDLAAKEMQQLYGQESFVADSRLLQLKKEISQGESIQWIYFRSQEALVAWARSTEELELSAAAQLAVRTREYIEAHYAEDITLAQIAEEFFVSAGHLSKVFSEEVGEPFSRYLQSFRLEEAKKLLLQSRHKVYEIASMAGYNDVAHFSKSFKQYTGHSPNKFRLLGQGGK